jgi:hypothetical protein
MNNVYFLRFSAENSHKHKFKYCDGHNNNKLHTTIYFYGNAEYFGKIILLSEVILKR